MKHYGDITKINGAEIDPVWIITGGSPCQDLSVAGKRAGLAGERSGLFMDQIRIIKEMRENDRKRNSGTNKHIRPRYMVWENVPGAFSSNKGEDFRAVLEETAKVVQGDACIPGPPNGKWPHSGCIMGDGWSIAWRVHDAQFWGVPQRRKRISLVADFGGETAPEILFERKGLSGDIAQGGKEGEGTSGNAERCTGETGTEPIVLESNQNHATIQTNGISTALPASAGMGGGYVPMVALTTEITPKIDDDGVAFSLRSRDYKDPQSVCYGISSYDSNGMKSDNPHAGIYKAKTARTLDLNGGNPACNQGGMAVVSVENHPADSRVKISDNGQRQSVHGCSIVRRLTPLEAERLQGFPDGWTDIGDWVDSKGKKHKGEADSPRYKALGNSIALPFWSWMAERMLNVLRADMVQELTMASLFDGIGGFPLVFSRHGCAPVWASEIEEFPIAVTKLRFGEE